MSDYLTQARQYLQALPEPGKDPYALNPGIPLGSLVAVLAYSTLAQAEALDKIADSLTCDYILDLLEAVESSGYQCEAGLLENNIAWRELKRLAKGERR